MYGQERELYEYHLKQQNSMDTGVSSAANSNKKSGLEYIYNQNKPYFEIRENLHLSGKIHKTP